MAVIFDEITAEVQSPARGTPEPPALAPARGRLDPNELARELERRAERQARLRTD